MTYDLIIRGATVVADGQLAQPCDVGVAEGCIAALEPGLAGEAREEVDATGFHLLPGLVDAHVHFNEPGRTDWEGWATGSAALAAGGVTCCVEMPLNAHPPTLDGPSFDAKLGAARAASLVDFALWGGLTPRNLDRLEELVARGVVGLKAFMSRSGTDDFEAADDLTLYAGMRQAARLGTIVAVHAESDTLTSGLAAQARAEGRTSWRDYLQSRPVVAELEAIRRAIFFAEEAGCALHIVHVSSGRGAALVAEARARGADVSWETCPHYLVLDEDDLERLGAVAKCAPPLRPAEDREALWTHLLGDDPPLLASDHSPAPPAMKRSADAFAVWGGISGCQSTLPLLVAEGEPRGLSPARLAACCATSVATRFGLARKGRIAVGADADLALVDMSASWELSTDELRYRHQQSPYVGRRMRGRVVRTILHGTTVYAEGQVTGSPGHARLVTPQAIEDCD